MRFHYQALVRRIGLICLRTSGVECDNQAVVHVSTNPVLLERIKYIKVVCHFIREKVQDKMIQLLPLKSKDLTPSCRHLTLLLPPLLAGATVTRPIVVLLQHWQGLEGQPTL